MTFTRSASRLAGVTALLLGWRPDEFWGATPEELAAIWRAARSEGGAGDPLDVGTLERLKEMYPDG